MSRVGSGHHATTYAVASDHRELPRESRCQKLPGIKPGSGYILKEKLARTVRARAATIPQVVHGYHVAALVCPTVIAASRGWDMGMPELWVCREVRPHVVIKILVCRQNAIVECLPLEVLKLGRRCIPSARTLLRTVTLAISLRWWRLLRLGIHESRGAEQGQNEG